MRKNLLGLWLLLFLITLLMGCGEEVIDEENGEAKTVRSLSILPSSASLKINQTQLFTATAEYTDGSSGIPSANWSVSGGIGTVTRIGLNALFTATTAGTGEVVAEYGGKSAAATVTVSSEEVVGELTTIEVAPASAGLRVGQTQTLVAVGKDATGEVVAFSPNWSITGDAIGILSFSETIATLEVTAEGSAVISCSSGEVVGYSYITVEGYVVEITAESDTYVDEANPDDIHWDDTSLKAGYVSATGKHYEAYLKFPLDSVPSEATIESATILVYPISAGDSSLQIMKLNSAFSSSTKWSNKPIIGSFITAGIFTAGDYNNISDDNLTNLVKAWKSGASANQGLAIVQEGSEDGVVVILSKEDGSNPPLLRVEYTK